MKELVAQEQGRLQALAYRILGSSADAQDVVQEAFLRYQDLDPATIRNSPALLTTMVTRLAVNVLGSARVRRESYVGPWLPEPIVTPAEPDPASISMAFMVLLETLSPRERAAFVLAKVFDHSHEEIASILGIEVAASRQLVHRARAHIEARKPRFRPAPDTHARLVQEFLLACQAGDPTRLGQVLADDVVARTDHGGKASAARKPVAGASNVARFLLGLLKRAQSFTAQIEVVPINGGPAVLVMTNGYLISVITFETDGERLCEINIVRNPDKLSALAQQRGLAVGV